MKQIYLTLFALLMSALLSSEAQAKNCTNGYKIEAKSVSATYVIPQGKILCRQTGSIAYIPAVGKEVGGDSNPPCGGTVQAYATDESKYIGAMKVTGGAMTATFAPWTAGVGIVVVGAAYLWESQLPGKTANCAISQIVLSKDQQVVHYAAFYGNNNDTGMPHPVDFAPTNPLNYTNTYSDDYYRVQGLPPIDIGKNQMMYSILFKNWATQTPRFRHARIMVDWVE